MTTLSDRIKQSRYGVAANPFQGADKKVLFVCSMGVLRSATGARLYAGRYNTRAAGTHSEALIQVTPLLLSWADEVVFVNPENYKRVHQNPTLSIYLEDVCVKVLDIPDKYEHMHPELISAFEQQYEALN